MIIIIIIMIVMIVAMSSNDNCSTINQDARRLRRRHEVDQPVPFDLFDHPRGHPYIYIYIYIYIYYNMVLLSSYDMVLLSFYNNGPIA